MPSPAEPRVPRATRATLPRGTSRRVLVRALAWTAAQAGVAAALSQVSGVSPAVAFGASVGAGLTVAHLTRVWAAAAGLGVLAAAWLADLAGFSPILSAGAAAGVLAAALARGPGGRQALESGFAGAAGAGLGAWLAGQLLPGDLAPALASGLHGAIAGLVTAQCLWLASVVWLGSDRPPRPRQVRLTLAPALHDPCVRAWELDQALARQAPDQETRDGLGEVAAWVYRLSWTLQTLGREVDALDPARLDARLEEARRAARESTDALTQEPREATVRHLEQLAAHRDALRLEQQRTSALIDYALAFLEQARAGLALARVRPGEGMPERLGDVLTRLRSQTAEGDARRRTARQLTPLA